MTIYGLDWLGMGNPNWKINKCIEVTPEGCMIGVFDSTFGDVVPNLIKCIESGKFPAFRIHLWWSNQHKICKKKLIKKRAPVYEQLAQDYPHIKFYLSHSCEHFETKKRRVKKRMKLLKKFAPSCIPVNAPDGVGLKLNGYINEVHNHDSSDSSTGGLYGVSNDGKEIFDMDVGALINNNLTAIYVVLWSFRNNLRQVGEDKSIPPKLRTDAPSKKEMKAICDLVPKNQMS